MKTQNLIVLMCVAGVIASFDCAKAQGRGNGKDDRNPRENVNRFDDRNDHRNKWNDRDHHRDSRWDDQNDRNRVHSHRFSHGRNSHHPPHWAFAQGYHKKPRYVYYLDYNVYYDCYRDEYITFSGSNYIYSYTMPPHLRRANFDRIVFIDLDFYDDDLPRYLERRRGSVSVSVHGRF